MKRLEKYKKKLKQIFYTNIWLIRRSFDFRWTTIQFSDKLRCILFELTLQSATDKAFDFALWLCRSKLWYSKWKNENLYYRFATKHTIFLQYLRHSHIDALYFTPVDDGYQSWVVQIFFGERNAHDASWKMISRTINEIVCGHHYYHILIADLDSKSSI